MSISQIFILAIAAILLGQFKKGRALAVLAVSAFAIYWLQPVQASITLTFWLPTLTLLLTVFSWWLTTTPDNFNWKENYPAAVGLAGVVFLVGMKRIFHLEQIFFADPPRIQWIGISMAVMLLPCLPFMRLGNLQARWYVIAVLGWVFLLLVAKMPNVLTWFFQVLSNVRGKESSVGWLSLSWLGFSYVSFRVMHTILDKRSGRLPSVSLAEYIDYVIFFPSFVAGPIDRLERFVRDLREPIALDREGWVNAGERLFAGLFKKFVFADGLAWIALNETFAKDIHSAGWMWVLLYAYSLRIYFDFSGYTDIAIGLGGFLGVRLPENFSAPYLKTNLTLFWNSWHMTLTQWFRSYFFNPLTRYLRSSSRIPLYIIIFLIQVATMALIGLWHGITINFLFWGLWHGIGLFLQNRWSNFIGPRLAAGRVPGIAQNVMKYLNVFLTLNFVSVGWLFFMLPTPDLTWQAMQKLMGLAI